MQLNLNLRDERTKEAATPYYTGRAAEREEYERAAVTDAVGNSRVIAGILRSIANEIDPPANAKAAVYTTSASGYTP